MAKDSSNALVAHAAYQRVPKEIRDKLADKVGDADLSNYEGVAEVSKHVLAALLRGDLPVDVCREAREILQVQLLAAAGKARSEEGGMRGGAVVLMEMVEEARSFKPKAITASYTTVDTPPYEPELIPVVEEEPDIFEEVEPVRLNPFLKAG